jgi:hypothetical protein
MSEHGTPSYLVYLGIFVAVFAVALGVFLWTAQSKTKEYNLEATKYKPQEAQKTEAAKPQSSSQSAEGLKVTVASPEDNAYINTNSVKVAGATKPGTTVTITGGTQDVVGETNSDGSFALDVGLKDGENKLVITIFDQAGQQKTVNKTVYAVVEG